MKTFKKQFLPLAIGIAALAGFEIEIFRPSWYFYILIGLIFLSFIASFFEQKSFSPAVFFQKFLLIFLFFLGIWTMFLYLESAFIRQALAALGAGFVAARFRFLGDAVREPEIEFLFMVFTAFFSAAAIFGLDLFFNINTEYLAAVSFLPGILLIYGMAREKGGPVDWGTIIAGAILWSELIFTMLMLPNGLYLGAAIAAIYIFIFGEIFYRKHFAQKAELKLVIFALILSLILFLTARWT